MTAQGCITTYQDPSIGRDPFPVLNLDNIPDNNVVGADFLWSTVPNHRTILGEEVLKAANHFPSLSFLIKRYGTHHYDHNVEDYSHP